MGINNKVSLSIKFANYLNPIGKEVISNVDKKGSKFFNKIENVFKNLSSNKKPKSIEFQDKAIFTELDDLTPPPIYDIAKEEENEEIEATSGIEAEEVEEEVAETTSDIEAEEVEEEVAETTSGIEAEEVEEVVVETTSDIEAEEVVETTSDIETEEEEKEAIVGKKADVIVEKTRKSLDLKEKKALKVGLALAFFAVAALSYYCFIAIPKESVATEAANTTVIEPIKYFIDSISFREENSSIIQNNPRIISECYKNDSEVRSRAYPIINTVANVTRNVTEKIIKQKSNSSKIQTDYIKSTAEVGKQFFKTTIGFFGQILAKSIVR